MYGIPWHFAKPFLIQQRPSQVQDIWPSTSLGLSHLLLPKVVFALWLCPCHHKLRSPWQFQIIIFKDLEIRCHLSKSWLRPASTSEPWISITWRVFSWSLFSDLENPSGTGCSSRGGEVKAEGKPEEYGKEKMLDLERWKLSDKAIKVARWFEALWQKDCQHCYFSTWEGRRLERWPSPLLAPW